MTTSPSKKRGAKKKLGRPLGSKNKPKKVLLSAGEVAFSKTMNVPLEEMAKAKIKFKRGRPAAASRASFKQVEHQRALHNIVDENLRLLEANRNLTSKVENLSHQVIGFRAVISYLENRLGMASSQ